MVKKIFFVSIITALSIILIACSEDSEKIKNSQSSESVSYDELKELIAAYGDRKVLSDAASITGEFLIITEGDEQSEIPLPEDEFFVSIAPYETYTHECAIHSLTGCQGELVNESFNVTVIDEKKNIVLKEEKNSGVNGFIDLWLPKNQKLNVLIEKEGKTVEKEITTFEDSYTCITTMKLISQS